MTLFPERVWERTYSYEPTPNAKWRPLSDVAMYSSRPPTLEDLERRRELAEKLRKN